MTTPNTSHGVALVNLGCRLNRVELDFMAADLEQLGACLVDEEKASAIVVNTCAVTAEAQAKTRKAIRHAAGLSQKPLVFATGCVATLFASELSSLGANVVVETDKSEVVSLVASSLGLAGTCSNSPCAQTPTPTGRTRPGIKIQDGCDKRCTYCIVWKARGRSRSVAPEEVLSQVRHAMARGAREVVLTGINLGDYRYVGPSGDKMRLSGLLDRILTKTSVERVRLSSIEPDDVDDDLLETIAASEGRVTPFLHICLQSGSDQTLRRMGRLYTTGFYREVVERAREVIGTVAIGTDLIVGFPGETDKEFSQSLAFCEEIGFARMHVFRYSKRPDTPAATMAGQVTPNVSRERSLSARALADSMRTTFAKNLVGKDDVVLVQAPGHATSSHLFDVFVDATIPVDSLVNVRFEGVVERFTLVGKLESRTAL